MSELGIEPITLLKGKQTVKDYYLGKPWPEATEMDIAELSSSKELLKLLNEKDLLNGPKCCNPVDVQHANYLLLQKFKEKFKEMQIPDLNSQASEAADKLPDSVDL